MDELVGRDSDLAELRRALSGPGGLVLLSGEAGIGKTRLAIEAARLSAQDGRPVVWARPEQVARPGPFALVLDLVENVGAAPKGPAADAAALAEQMLHPADGGGGAVAVRRIAARLRGLLAQTGSRPVAVFEDLHVADDASHAVLVHLARTAADDGRLMIGTYRSEELGASDELERFLGVVTKERLAREIALSPLDGESATRLAEAVIGPDADRGKAAWIARSGEGVPFFIEELAAAFARTGSIEGVPGSISRAVLARGHRLGAVARQVVSTAALLSGPIDADVIAAAMSLDVGAVSRALAEAARAGIVEDRDGRLVFRHALVREAIASDMVSVEAEQLHRALADAIERVHATDVPAHAKALAHHWYEGRDRNRALRYALEAGERALGLAATHDARLAFELAGACSDQPPPEALMGLAEVDVREGRGGDAEALFGRAADGFLQAGRRAEAARAMGRVGWVRTVEQHYAGAVEALDQALALLPADSEMAVRASLLAQKGRIFRGVGDPSERRHALLEAASIAEQLGEHAIHSDALDGLAWAAFQDRQSGDALRYAAHACASAMRSGRAEAIGRSHNNYAVMLGVYGQPEKALEIVEAARQRLEEGFGSMGAAVLNLTEALVWWRMGRPNQVARLVARAEIAWSHFRGLLVQLQAWSSLHGGDVQRAHAIVDRALTESGLNAGSGGQITVGLEDVDAAVCALFVRLEEARLEESLPALSRAVLEYQRAGGQADAQMLALMHAARAHALAGDVVRARAFVAEAESILAQTPAPYFSAAFIEIQGIVASAVQGNAGALELFMTAAEAFEKCANVVDRARCLRLAAEHDRAGESKARVEVLRRARALAADAGSHLEVGRIEAAMRALGARPRAGRPRKDADVSATGLSAREEEVAALVGAGATNAEIAARLFLSERTVQDHVTHALRKLSLSGRAALAAWAAKHGLV